MEYNCKKVEKSHYTLIIISTFISCFLFVPLWFKKYIILYSFLHSTLFVTTYLNLKSKNFFLALCFVVEVLDTSLLGIFQIKYLVISYMSKYLHRRLKLKNFIILTFCIVSIIIMFIFTEYLIKIYLGFHCDIDEYIFNIIYTSLFSVILIKLIQSSEQ